MAVSTKRKSKRVVAQATPAIAPVESGAISQLPRGAVAIPVLLPLAVYFYTAAPSVTLVDSGEFVLACSKLGIGHAPGVPTYVLLGHLFSLLPISADLARRTNLFSSFCCALAAGFAYLLTRELLRDLDPRLALAGALAYGFSSALWSWAVVTEVYALNILLVTILLWLAARGQWIPGCFVAGLALGVHHATVLMTLPAAFYLAWIRRKPSVKTLLLAAAAGLAGLSVYLYLPIRAAQHPILNWGDPETLQRFWYHVSGKQYRGTGGAYHGLGYHLKVLGTQLLRQLTPIGFLVAFAGLIALFRRHRDIFWFTIALAGCDAGFIVITDLGGLDITGYYLPALLTMSWCFAIGAASLAVGLGGLRRKWVLVAVFAVALIPAVANFPANNRHDDRIAPLFVENSLRGVSPGSLVLDRDWNFHAPWMALHFAEGLYPGVEVINTDFLRQSWFMPALERDDPELYRGAATELAALRRVQDLADRDLPYDNEEAGRLVAAVVRKFIHIKLDAGQAVFYTPKIDTNFLPESTSVPHGILYQYAQGAEDVELDLSGLLGEAPLGDPETRVRGSYTAMLSARAAYLTNIGQYEAARQKLDLALRLDPSDEKALKLKKLLP
jgi:hypothetical protein